MWEKLSYYLKGKNVLEVGCGVGQKTKEIIKYVNSLTSIDVCFESIKLAKENFKDEEKVNFLCMDASKMQFDDDSFDVIITTDSFHEIETKIQDKVLQEFKRIAKTIIFIEPDEISVTNELFRVFDPNENHGLRIKNSMDKIFNFMRENNYNIIYNGEYNDVTSFSTEQEMYETLLSWRSDIKIPSNDNEKNEMINNIKIILDKFNVEKLQIIEKIHYYVFRSE